MFVLSVGINLSFHFHEGDLICFSLIGNSDFCCLQENHPKHDCCAHSSCNEHNCQTDFLNITLEDDFLVKSFEYTSEYVSLAVKGFHLIPHVNSPSVLTESNQTHAHPKVPLYVKNASFLFYG